MFMLWTVCADPSVLPVFSSPSIEAHLHRIPGLSKKFIYFNDDVFLGAPTWPSDFWTPETGQKVYLAWDVPRCNEGCIHGWIGDGYCDVPCNVSSCDFDGGDCKGQFASRQDFGSFASGSGLGHTEQECSSGCPIEWLGDEACDPSCRVAECAWDMGDCGMDVVHENVPTYRVEPKRREVVMPFCDKEQTLVNITGFLSAESLFHTVHINNGTRSLSINLKDAIRTEGLRMLGKDFMRLFPDPENDETPCILLEALETYLKPTRVSFVGGDQDSRAPVLSAALEEKNEILLYLFDTRKMVNFVDLLKSLQKAVDDQGKAAVNIHMKDARFRTLAPSVERGDNSINIYDCAFVSWVDENVDSLKKLKETKQSPSATVTSLDLKSDPQLTDVMPILSSIKEDELELVSDTASMLLKLSDNLRSDMCAQIFEEDGAGLPGITWDVNIDMEMFADDVAEDKNNDISNPFHYCTRASSDSAVHCKEVNAAVDHKGLSSGIAGSLKLRLDTVASIKPPNMYNAIRDEVGKSVKARLDARAEEKQNKNATKTHDRKLLSSDKHHIAGIPGPSNSVAFRRLSGMTETEKRNFVSTIWNEVQGSPLSSTNAQAQRDVASRQLMDLFAESLAYTDNMLSKVRNNVANNKIITELYSASDAQVLPRSDRKVIAHMPHMIDVEVMEELQTVFHDDFEATGNRRFRSPKDIQYSFAYFYWLMEGTKRFGIDLSEYWRNEIDTDHNGYVTYS